MRIKINEAHIYYKAVLLLCQGDIIVKWRSVFMQVHLHLCSSRWKCSVALGGEWKCAPWCARNWKRIHKAKASEGTGFLGASANMLHARFQNHNMRRRGENKFHVRNRCVYAVYVTLYAPEIRPACFAPYIRCFFFSRAVDLWLFSIYRRQMRFCLIT